jgi:prepilin-type N-terminal cleavage/methylation domain-containing protein
MRHPPAGLTLIELLVTLAVLSILSIVSFRALESLVTSRDRLLGQALVQRQTALTFAQMEADLQAFRRLNHTQRRAALRVTPTDQGWVLELPEARWTFDRNQLVRKPLQGPGTDMVLMTNLHAAGLALILPARSDQPFDPGRAWNWPDSTDLAGLKVSIFRASVGMNEAQSETSRIFLLGRPNGSGG